MFGARPQHAHRLHMRVCLSLPACDIASLATITTAVEERDNTGAVGESNTVAREVPFPLLRHRQS